MTKTIHRARPKAVKSSDSLNITEMHIKIMKIIEGQDEVFPEFIADKTGLSIPKSNSLMAEVAVLTNKYIPQIAWVCPKCREPSKIPLLEGLRILQFGSTTVECKFCSHVVTVKAWDTILSWKTIEE